MTTAGVIVTLALVAQATEVRPGMQTASSLLVEQLTAVDAESEAAPFEVRYLTFVPQDYGKTDKRWPLLLFLHGAGERGDDLPLVKTWGPPKLVEEQPDFPFIVVSPQCPKNEFWKTNVLIQLVDHVTGTLDVDPDRIYVTGLSMGGFGTFSLSIAHPDRFAAAAAICGGGNPKKAPQLVDLPLWAFHGEEDEVVPVRRSREMVQAIQEAGGTKVKLTIYPEVGHDSWRQAYADPELYQWLLANKRGE